MHWPSV
ncbi:hypothetical protein D018_0722A, partial [Vibrio parahaemolyticus VP2007-007]